MTNLFKSNLNHTREHASRNMRRREEYLKRKRGDACKTFSSPLSTLTSHLAIRRNLSRRLILSIESKGICKVESRSWKESLREKGQGRELLKGRSTSLTYR